MVHNLRAYFILSVITFKCIECTQEKIEFSSMLQTPRLVSTKILGDLSLATMIKHQQKLQENCQGVAKNGILLSRGGSCHPMPLHGYGPFVKSKLSIFLFNSLPKNLFIPILKFLGPL